ncbi:oxidoreductase, short-chain dehydrogenase/reductase family [Aspergillus mulundensis]|uniref:Uncharacterized protein n=1 Tax=Aspergillus mulundensis TaxID=1810919 RepID=A0A3D8QVE8_9EURO|nr:hypothetical protein DSM5745_09572 [Aspergillus mulundensis]RDW65833.1 hypothetical protein DSM5745_09572 [Aspergillus mulundensis]
MDDFSAESWPLEDNDSSSRFIHRKYITKGSTEPPAVAGILSLHNYRKSLSHDRDSSWIDDQEGKTKTLRRKNASTNLNENDHHAQGHVHSSTPTPSTTSTSSPPPSLSRSDSPGSTLSEPFPDFDPSDRDKDTRDPAPAEPEQEPIPFATPRPRPSPTSTTMMYEGTPFEIMNPHESLVVSRIESYMPEPEPEPEPKPSIHEHEHEHEETLFSHGLDPGPGQIEALYATWNEKLNNPTAIVYSDYKPKRKRATLLKTRKGHGHAHGLGHGRKVSASFKRLKSFFVFRS